MQTFLAYSDFQKSAECLDPSRLGNQVYRECRTLIGGGWVNHPIAKMWRGYEHALAEYSLACLDELKKRGRYYPIHIEFFTKKLKEFPDTGMPPWFGNEEFHASHRANLLRKNYDYYIQFGWTESPDTPYLWFNPESKIWYNTEVKK